ETQSSSHGVKRPIGSLAYLGQARTKCAFDIGPPAWVKKKINTITIEDHLLNLLRSRKSTNPGPILKEPPPMVRALPAVFCDAIGLQETCLITLKSTLCGARSWLVCLTPNKKSSHRVRSGWKRFCKENELKVGDVCTFNIIETRLWHVDIERYQQFSNSSHNVI
ncbi:hypothetical protein EJB05_50916, partial [Eragrostis curvula]